MVLLLVDVMGGRLHCSHGMYEGLLLPPFTAEPLETRLQCGKGHALGTTRAACT